MKQYLVHLSSVLRVDQSLPVRHTQLIQSEEQQVAEDCRREGGEGGRE